MTTGQSITSPSEDSPVQIRILLADDHPLLRQALRSVLEKQPDFSIVAEVDDGEEAVKLATELVPDVVVMDISMPKLDGLEATKQIKTKCPSISVLVLTVHDDNERILGILEAGAAGYLTKKVFGDEVVRAIRAVVAGDTILSADISQRIFKHALRHTSQPIPVAAADRIVARDLKILRMVAKGMSNKTIAEELGLSVRTVKAYLAEIFSKLGVATRTEAVIVALKAGMLTINDIA